MSSPADAPNGRSLSIPGYIGIFVVYLVFVQGVSLLVSIGDDADYAKFPDTSAVLRHLWVPVGGSAIIVALIITWLRWWRPVWRDDANIPPLPRWVWVVPVVMVVTILGGMNYGDLIDRGAGYIVLFAIGALFIGFAEEGMFRGIGVTAFRANGYSEAKVALWVSLIFGLAHGTNIFTEGTSAIAQVLVTAAAGFFFYLARRLGRGLLLPLLLHAAWDFALFTGNLGEDTYVGAAAFVGADVLLVIVLLIGAKKLHLNGEPAAAMPA